MSSHLKKVHSREYLEEYRSKDISAWVKLLIEKVLDNSNSISEKNKEEVFNKLLEENEIDFNKRIGNIEEATEVKEINTIHTHKNLILQKIAYKSGVNALIHNQSLVFSNTCTILYGLNGTGKSGYFRIIHELAGGDKTKQILGNIYMPTENLDVEVEYLLDNILQPVYNWKKLEDRGVYPFNQIKVFDSEYLPLFLDERESLVNIEPLGLNLFKIISNTIDEFKIGIESLKSKEQLNKIDLRPLIDTVHLDSLKEILQKILLTKEDADHLKKYTAFTSINLENLTKVKEQKNIIEKQNIDDTKKVITQEKTEIDTLKTHIDNIKPKIEKIDKQISIVINDYLNFRRVRDEQKQGYEIIKTLPAQDTDEWQSFVESAKSYAEKIYSHEFDSEKNCIYCHQPLADSALELIQSYTKYLSDQSQSNLKSAENRIKELQIILQSISPDFQFTENLRKILKEGKVDNKTLYDLINKIIEKATSRKTTLQNSLAKFELIDNEFTLDLNNIENPLKKLSEERQKTLDNLEQSEEIKKKKILEINNEILELEDKQNITHWKDRIKQYFITNQKISKYESVNKNISTRGITDLGSKAHDELLTDSIRQAFDNQLKALGKDIEVKLEKTSAGKGGVRTRLRILGKDVPSILSEGEQKTVGLALFLAEIESQKASCPVVFDDPVTSLDHEVAHVLAKNLLLLSLNHQVIILTHNKFFYDSLIYWCSNLRDHNNVLTHHVCKNYIPRGCGGTNCHVYTYRVDRESKEKTGKLFEYQNESLRYYIEKVENDLKGNYSPSVVAGYLKSAIEYYIDEKIFNNHGLVKDQKVKDHIEWPKLKAINFDPNTIQELHNYWEELSSRGTHLTASSSENSLKLEELNNIIQFLKK